MRWRSLGPPSRLPEKVWQEDFGRLCKRWGSLALVGSSWWFQPNPWNITVVKLENLKPQGAKVSRWTYKNDWKPPTSDYLLFDFKDSGRPIGSSFRIGKYIFPHDHCCSPNITGFFCHQEPIDLWIYKCNWTFSEQTKFVPSNEGVYSLLRGSSHDLQVINNHGDRFRSPRPGGLFPFQMAVSFIKAPVNGGDPITMQKKQVMGWFSRYQAAQVPHERL